MLEKKEEISAIDKEIADLENEIGAEEGDEVADTGEETTEEEDSTSNETETSETGEDDQTVTEKKAEETTEEEEDEIPDDKRAAFKKANYWRREARELQKQVKELNESIPNLVEEAIRKRLNETQENEEYRKARSEVERIVKDILQNRDVEIKTNQEKYDQIVKDQIAECEEEFGDKFDRIATLKFAKEMRLPSLRTAHLWLMDRQNTKEKTAEIVTKKMIKKSKANLPGEGGGGTVDTYDYGISKGDNLNVIKAKIIQGWKNKE